MALQDLTPQLRTRLSRMERAVGWFVFLATVLLLFGFGYYIYHTAERKGWFKIKAPFHVFVQSSAGLNVKDPVYMMGFQVGEITSVEPQQPYDPHNVMVKFEIVEPYFRYIWLGGSYVKVNAADFLGKRQLEVTRGTNGPAIVVTQPGAWKTIPELEQLVATQTNRWQLYQDVLDGDSNMVFGAYTMLTQSNLERIAELKPPTNSVFAYDNKPTFNRIVASWDNRARRYVNFTPSRDTAWLRAVETPPISDQLQAMVLQVQTALPNVLALTNKIAAVLDNAAEATSNLNVTLVETRPMITNFAAHQFATARAGRPAGLGAGHKRKRAIARLADECQRAARSYRHEPRRAAHQPRQHHEQLERAGAGQLEHFEQRLQDCRGHGRLRAGIEAALAAALGVQE